MSRCNTCVHRSPGPAMACDNETAEGTLAERSLSFSQFLGDDPVPEWCPGYLPVNASALVIAEALAGTNDAPRKPRGRRGARSDASQPKLGQGPQIVAVHFRDIIPGLDMRGIGQRAYKRGDASWRGYDVEIVPGFVVLTAPAREGRRAVFRVPESMCIVVTEVPS